MSVEDLVSEWLSIEEVAARVGTSPNGVRRLLEERELIGLRRGTPKRMAVPAAFLVDRTPLASLKGTVTVLGDNGFDDEEIIEWLFTPDETLPGGGTHAVDALHAGFKTEVRRRAMELG